MDTVHRERNPEGDRHSREAADRMGAIRSAERPREGRVVVGVDGSAASAAALRWAVDYARRTGAPVEAVAVWHQPIQFGTAVSPPHPRREFAQAARAWLTTALKECDVEAHPVALRSHTAEGDPPAVLVQHATGAGLLVLGNHGRGPWASAALGSVAQRCAQLASCPVVLVPAVK